MLLNPEELLALINGDAEPDRLADLLDRLERCPDSVAALQVLVSLRAHREEALEALRSAPSDAAPMPIPHPSFRPGVPSMGWARQGLRLAATVAIVAVISVWASSSYFGGNEGDQTVTSVDTTVLATKVYKNSVGPGPTDVRLTSDVDTALAGAHDAMEAAEYRRALSILDATASHDEARANLYRGMCRYFLGEYETAYHDFVAVRANAGGGESGILHQAAWYEANALLAMDLPMNALPIVESLKTALPVYPFQAAASDLYGELREALGLTTPKQD